MCGLLGVKNYSIFKELKKSFMWLESKVRGGDL